MYNDSTLLNGEKVSGDIYKSMLAKKVPPLQNIKMEYKHAVQDKNKATMKLLKEQEDLKKLNNPDAYSFRYWPTDKPTTIDQLEVVATAKKDLVRASYRLNQAAKNYKKNIEILKKDVKDYGYITE